MRWSLKLVRATAAILAFVGVAYAFDTPVARAIADGHPSWFTWLRATGAWGMILVLVLYATLSSAGLAVVSIAIKRLHSRRLSRS